MGLFRKKKITLDDANEKNKEFISKNSVPRDVENALMREASNLMTQGKHKESIDIYLKISNDYPNNKGLYLSQVGANYYFLSEFLLAIDFYMKALNEGANSDMMDDNVWEACMEIYKNSNDKSPIKKYIELFPKGSYKKKANKLILK